jgi:hypothetical protein
MAFRTFHYGLRQLIVSRWLGENTYGDAVRIHAANAFTVQLGLQQDELPGDDVIVDSYAKIVRVNATLTYGSVDQEVLSILTGASLYSDEYYETTTFGQDDNVPFFSIAGRVVGSNFGDQHIWIAKAKLAGDLSYEARQNAYLIPSAQIRGVWEGEANGFGKMNKFSVPTLLTIPLRNEPGGLD